MEITIIRKKENYRVIPAGGFERRKNDTKKELYFYFELQYRRPFLLFWSMWHHRDYCETLEEANKIIDHMIGKNNV